MVLGERELQAHKKISKLCLGLYFPRNGLLDVHMFSSVLKLCLFPSADGAFSLGCTLRCVYAVNFLLLETFHPDCVENAECADVMECGEHLAQAMCACLSKLTT